MPFTDDPSAEQIAADTAATQAAADKATQEAAATLAAQQSTNDDHNKVFLVAGTRAFADAGAVVKHVEHSQTHIATLETEAEASRGTIAEQAAEILRLKKIEEALNGQSTSGTADQTDLLSNEQLAANAAKLAQGLIKDQNTVDEQNANLALSEGAAKEAYGEAYRTKVNEIAKGLDMTLAAVDALGRTSPDAFAQLFLPVDPGQTSHQPSFGSLRRDTNTDSQDNTNLKPSNIVKLRERDRIALVAEKMKAAGVEGYI